MNPAQAAQLALDFAHQTTYRAADLLPHAGQDEARTWLERSAEWPHGRLVLWGDAGSGKSHLLHAWAERHGGAVLSEPPAVADWPRRPAALDGLHLMRDETALLHLLNAAAEAGQPVLLGSLVPPARLVIGLPDLASRLRATISVQIGPAPDTFLEMLLARLLAERQLRLPIALQSWLLTRLPRTPAALRGAVARLDAVALETQRTITRPLAVRVLGLYDSPDAAPSPLPHPSPGPG